jgi:hypothetical protein
MKFTSTILLILFFFVTSLLLFSYKKEENNAIITIDSPEKIEILLIHEIHHFTEQIFPKALHQTYHSIK